MEAQLTTGSIGRESGGGDYRITVEGSLSEQWSDRLAGMQISVRPRLHRKPLTILAGRVRDQAALFGVLNSLYELQLRILSVESTAACETTPHDYPR